MGPMPSELLQDNSAPSCHARLASLCSEDCACLTHACLEEKEEQVLLSPTGVLSGKEGEDEFRRGFDRV